MNENPLQLLAQYSTVMSFEATALPVNARELVDSV